MFSPTYTMCKMFVLANLNEIECVLYRRKAKRKNPQICKEFKLQTLNVGYL